jgi:hypothetical protein
MKADGISGEPASITVLGLGLDVGFEAAGGGSSGDPFLQGLVFIALGSPLGFPDLEMRREPPTRSPCVTRP